MACCVGAQHEHRRARAREVNGVEDQGAIPMQRLRRGIRPLDLTDKGSDGTHRDERLGVGGVRASPIRLFLDLGDEPLDSPGIRKGQLERGPARVGIVE
jgi:hypothetical protein